MPPVFLKRIFLFLSKKPFVVDIPVTVLLSTQNTWLNWLGRKIIKILRSKDIAYMGL